MKTIVIFLCLALAAVTPAQESPGYELSDYSFNVGGHTLISSSNYQVTSVSVGASAVATETASSSFSMDCSFAACYPPPGEVRGLLFTSRDVLVWDPEKSAGNYNLYRDLMSNVTGLGYGVCEQHDVPANSTIDSDPPPGGDGYFYLVTAENRLDEEGAKGWDSTGAPRPNSDPCP